MWGGGGMAWDPAAAALRLTLALGTARGMSGDPPPPPPGTDGGREPSQQGASTNRGPAGMEPGAARCRPLPPIPPPAHCPGPPATCRQPLLPMARGPRGWGPLPTA